MTVRLRLIAVLLAVAFGLLPVAAGRQAARAVSDEGEIGPEAVQKVAARLFLLKLQSSPSPETELERLLKSGAISPDARRQIERLLGERSARMPSDLLKELGSGLLGGSGPRSDAVSSPGGAKPPPRREPSKADPPAGRPTEPDAAREFNPDQLANQPRPGPEVGGVPTSLPRAASARERLGISPEAAEKFLKMWERNFGPLDKSPQLKQAVLDLFEAGDGLRLGADGKSFWSALGKEGWDAGGFLKDMDRRFASSGFEFPDLNFGKLDLGGRLDWGGSSAGGWSGGGSSWGGDSSSWTPVILLAVFAVGGLLLWRYWPGLMGKDSESSEKPLGGLGPWPIDPRAVADRAGLVKAFEYLSVLLCGDAARVWNHTAIAAALRERAAAGDALADRLAGHYVAARYAPPAEPLADETIADARRCLCLLAGVRLA